MTPEHGKHPDTQAPQEASRARTRHGPTSVCSWSRVVLPGPSEKRCCYYEKRGSGAGLGRDDGTTALSGLICCHQQRRASWVRPVADRRRTCSSRDEGLPHLGILDLCTPRAMTALQTRCTLCSAARERGTCGEAGPACEPGGVLVLAVDGDVFHRQSGQKRRLEAQQPLPAGTFVQYACQRGTRSTHGRTKGPAHFSISRPRSLPRRRLGTASGLTLEPAWRSENTPAGDCSCHGLASSHGNCSASLLASVASASLLFIYLHSRPATARDIGRADYYLSPCFPE